MLVSMRSCWCRRCRWSSSRSAFRHADSWGGCKSLHFVVANHSHPEINCGLSSSFHECPSMRSTLSRSTLPAALLARVVALLLMGVAMAASAGVAADAAAGGWQPLSALVMVTDGGFAADTSAVTEQGAQKPGLKPHRVKLRRRQSPVFAALQVPAESHQALLAFQQVALDADQGAQHWDRVSCTGFPGDASTCRSGASRAPPALI